MTQLAESCQFPELPPHQTVDVGGGAAGAGLSVDEEAHEVQAGQNGGALTQFASAAAVRQYAYATHCSSHVLQATPPVLHALLQLLDCMMMTVAPALARVVSS